MAKQLIVVVHGVGVKEAGVSADLLATALERTPESVQASVTGPKLSDATLTPHSSDDFNLRELSEYNTRGRREYFPARIRRYRHYVTDNEGKKSDLLNERVIADFYWGNIALVGATIADLLMAILKTILGLSHAIRENAREVFPNITGWHRRMRRLAGYAALTIHGPIAAINIVLVGGVLVRWALSYVQPEMLEIPGWAAPFPIVTVLALIGLLRSRRPAIKFLFCAAAAVFAILTIVRFPPEFTVAAITIVAGALMQLKSSAFLQRMLAAWLILTGTLLMAFWLSATVWPASHGATGSWMLDTTLRRIGCERLDSSREIYQRSLVDNVPIHDIRTHELDSLHTECITDYRKHAINTYGLRLLAISLVFWLLVFSLAIIVAVGEFVRFIQARRNRISRVKSIVTPAIGLMALLWLLLISGLWATLGRVGLGIIPNPEHVRSALVPLVVVLATIILIIVAAVIALFQKTELKSLDPKDYFEKTASFFKYKRLIVSPYIVVVLYIFVTTMLVFSIFRILKIFSEYYDFEIGYFERGLTGYLNIADYVEVSLAITGILGLLAVGALAKPLSAALGILTDVLTYLNDYSWDSNETFKKAMKAEDVKGTFTRTFLERSMKPFGFTPMPHRPGQSKSGYWLRGRIQNRLIVLVDQLIRNEQPDHLVLVSHSQGTVVAIDVLAMKGKDWRQRMRQPATIKLVTMGSPYSHIHSYYFPTSFEPVSKRMALKSTESGGFIDCWLNIFRIDDFVGTHIEYGVEGEAGGLQKYEQVWPREIPVPPNGHTMYWVDENVFPHLRSFMEFELDPGTQPKSVTPIALMDKPARKAQKTK